MDLYAILDLDANATLDDIRKAYKRMALLYHPDKNHGFESKQFTDIKSAYDILSDPLQRGIYDDERCKAGQGQVVDWKQFMGDVMTSMYVLFATYIVPKDIKLSIEVKLSDVYNRRVKKIDVKVKRWSPDGLKFTNGIQSIYIPLNNFKKEQVFEGQGDDSIIKSKTRSSIKVSLTMTEFPPGVHIQEMLNDYDLYIIKDITLYEFYACDTLTIPLCQGQDLEVPNTKQHNYVVPNAALPFGTEGGRGDVFIKVNVSLPPHIPESVYPMLMSHFNNTQQ